MPTKKVLYKVGDKVLVPLSVAAGGTVLANQVPPIKRAKKKFKEIAETPIIKSDDPLFNHKAAQEAYQLVMKMDEEEARVFTSMVVSDVLEDEIEANQRTLQAHLDRVVSKRISDLKKATVRTVSKGADEEALAFAQALSRIEKAKNPYDFGYYRFEESDFRRDPSTGRFQTKLKVNSNAKGLNRAQEKSFGIPKPANDKLDGRARAQYQQEYMQIATFLDSVYEGAGDADVYMHVKNKATGQRHFKPVLQNGRGWDPETERVIGLEAKPKGLNIGGAAFGLTNSLGSPMSQGSVKFLNDAGNQQRVKTFADEWTSAGDTNNSNQRLYDRMAAGSKYLGEIAPAGSKLQMAAAFGQFVGSRGPEAERVFGPTTRKLAYRYRGTERTPDAELAEIYSRNVRLENRPSGELTVDERRAMKIQQNRAVSRAREAKAAQINEGRNRDTFIPIEAVSLTQTERQAVMNAVQQKFMADRAEKLKSGRPSEQGIDSGRLAVAEYLQNKVRDKEMKNLYGLQLEAGNTPPSEGILIDKDGKLVSQAVGYGDDHYLPFNLRNLRALKGGEYIRSRSVGGPTTEDIYTARVMGAKRLTVVSRSGMFTVDFEDDFRGGRRHNDKAKRMTGRYAQILDAVQSEQVDRQQSVSPEVRAFITARVREEYKDFSRQDQRKAIKDGIDEYKRELEMTAGDESEFNAYFEEQSADMSEVDRNRLRGQMMNDWQKHNEFKFRLNGFGYRDALKALEQQFPYYIKTNYVPTQELERFEPEKDKGYVEPGRNRPTEAKAGLYGTAVRLGGLGNEAGGKFSASQADYQGGSASRTGRVINPQEAARTESKDQNTDEFRAKVARRRAEGDRVKAITKVINEIGPRADEEAKREYPWLNLAGDDAALGNYVKNPANVAKIDRWMKQHNNFSQYLAPEDVRNYANAMGKLDRVEYSPDLGLTANRAFLFPGDAYADGAPEPVVNKEVAKVGSAKSFSYTNKTLAQLSDDEIQTELEELVDLHSFVEGMDLANASPDKKKAILRETGHPNAPGSILDDLPGHIKRLHRMKALNLNRKEREEPGTIAVPTPTVQHRPEPRRAGDETQTTTRTEVQQNMKRLGDLLREVQNRRGNESPEYARVAAALEDGKNLLRAQVIEPAHVEAWLESDDVQSAMRLADYLIPKTKELNE